MVFMLLVAKIADLRSDTLDSFVLDAITAEDHSTFAAVMSTLKKRKVILTLETTLGLAVWHPVLFLIADPKGLSHILLLIFALLHLVIA